MLNNSEQSMTGTTNKEKIMDVLRENCIQQKKWYYCNNKKTKRKEIKMQFDAFTRKQNFNYDIRGFNIKKSRGSKNAR